MTDGRRYSERAKRGSVERNRVVSSKQSVWIDGLVLCCDAEFWLEFMNRDLAILIINACYRASRELGEMGVMVSEQGGDELGLKIKNQAGRSIGEIGLITEELFKLYPDLEQYVEGQISRFGRVS